MKGTGPAPFQGVQTLTQTCGGPSQGFSGPFDDPYDPGTDVPFQAATWAALAPGEIRHEDTTAKPILPNGGNPTVGQAFDPISGGGACATTSGTDQLDTANYRLDPAPAGGFTLMGSPTIIADINSPSPTSQIAARLTDVGPDGQQTLVARGLYRPEVNVGADPTRQVFQLHPNGWKFEAGHVAKLELLPADQPYGRNSNGQGPITVSNLELRLPVLESPNGGLIQSPATKVVPADYELAADYLSGGGDADGDGVPDAQDDCDTAPGPPANNGCPVIGADTDNDGIPNSQDQCPNLSGPAANGGCPQSAGANPPAVGTGSSQTPTSVPGKKCKKRGKRKGTVKKARRCKKRAKRRR